MLIVYVNAGRDSGKDIFRQKKNTSAFRLRLPLFGVNNESGSCSTDGAKPVQKRSMSNFSLLLLEPSLFSHRSLPCYFSADTVRIAEKTSHFRELSSPVFLPVNFARRMINWLIENRAAMLVTTESQALHAGQRLRHRKQVSADG